MSEQLDIAFKNRILDAFENYEDNTADAGWELLRQKFPEKKKDKVIAWWYSAAAGLLLLAGVFFMLNKKPETVTYQNNKKPKQDILARSKDQQSNSKLPLPNNNKPAETPGRVTTPRTAQQVYINKKPLSNSTTLTNITKNAGNTPLLLDKAIATPSVIGKQSIAPSLTGISNLPPINQISKLSNTGILQHDTAKALSNNVAFNQEKKPESSVLPVKPVDPVLKMMADDKAKQAKAIVTKETKNKESLVALSPYAATYFNYAKGSSNQVNVGAGVTTDFKISSNFKLSTGVAIAQNTLNFDNGNVPQRAAANARAFADATVASSSPSGTFLSNTVYSLNNYKANLIGLDIPINFKYQFNPAKNDTYISAGISSGTFINETYSSTVQYNNFFNATTTTSTPQVNSNSQHFGTFDFAKTVNFSFGVGYPLGTNKLIVEPFLKYPIGGLGSQNLRFGASGVNLKFSFSNAKK